MHHTSTDEEVNPRLTELARATQARVGIHRDIPARGVPKITARRRDSSEKQRSVAASRQTHREKILDKLVAANGGWVPSPELAAASLQHSARVRELRLLGHHIENRTVVEAGRKRGYFRLIAAPMAEPEAAPESIGGQQELLFDLGRPDRRHRDEG